MAWTEAFRSALSARQLRPEWVLRRIWSPDSAKWLPEDVLCSRNGLGGTPGICAPPKVSGSRIAPLTWSPTYGAWEVTCLPTLAGTIATRLPRGALCQLLLGVNGMARDEFQPIALGRVRTIAATSRGVVIRCWDVATGLSARLTNVYAATRLFQDVDVETTLSSGYTAGDDHLHIASNVFSRETGGAGLVKVTPGTGDPFYLTYTGSSSSQLTGVSTSAVRNTTAASAGVGCVVSNVGYVAGHPFDCARKILTSGTGSGDYAVLPDYWGLAVPDDLVDNDDADHWRERVDATDGTSWEIAAEAPIEGGWSWLSTVLSAAGIWFVQRMGAISLRAILDPEEYSSFQGTVTESDLAEGDAWSMELWDQEVSAEAGSVDVVSASSHTPFYSTHLETAPGQYACSYDLSSVIFGNEANQRIEVGGRLEKWAFRPSERLTLRLSGWRFADLCPGDALYLNLPSIRGRLSSSARTYVDWPAVVSEVAPDFSRCETRVVCWPVRETYSG